MAIETLYKVINNRRYDARVAKHILEREENLRSFQYVHEILCRKKNGEYFLAGEGGAASKYSRSLGPNEWKGGEGIIPLTDSEAREWVETYFDGATYDAVFGKNDLPEDTETVGFRLPAPLTTWLRRQAAIENCNITDVLVRVLRKEIIAQGSSAETTDANK